MNEQLDQEIVVVKYGSASLTDENGMDSAKVEYYTEQLSHLYGRYGVVVVGSGAIAVGRIRFASLNPHNEAPISERSLATAGSSEAYKPWEAAFANKHIITGQIQVTHREIDDASEGGMLSKTLHENLDVGMVSVVNENDALSDLEIAALSYGGDNDGLAAHLAVMIGARHLCLMTDVEGLLTEQKILVPEVNSENAEWAKGLAGGAGPDGLGRGGMHSKVEAARKAAENGVEAHIAHAQENLYAVTNRQLGTHFITEYDSTARLVGQ